MLRPLKKKQKTKKLKDIWNTADKKRDRGGKHDIVGKSF